MITVSTKVSNDQTAWWVQAVRETATAGSAGAYRIECGDASGDVVARVELTTHERHELIRSLGGTV